MRPQHDPEPTGPWPTPALEVERGEERKALCGALRLLPPHYYTVIELHHYCGLTFAEIGSRLFLTPDAARMVWHRALAALRCRLQHHDRLAAEAPGDRRCSRGRQDPARQPVAPRPENGVGTDPCVFQGVETPCA